jgi:hypothetical protein
MLGAPTSLASIMVIGPHHAAVTHVGGSSEVGQREHMVRAKGSLRKCWSEFLCLGDYLAPPRQAGGFAPRDALGRHPSAGPRRWRTAGGPVAGAQLTYNTSNLLWCHFYFGISGLAASGLHNPRAFAVSNIANSVPMVRIPSTL